MFWYVYFIIYYNVSINCDEVSNSYTASLSNHILGLDPAGIGYSVEYDGPGRGLNATCCQYVQAIHTDPQIGSLQAMGHIDFYPNNVTGLQPHCRIQETGCSHQSVVEYYKAALDPSNTFMGRSCGRSKFDAKMNCKFGPHNTDNCTGIACFDTAPCAPYVYL